MSSRLFKKVGFVLFTVLTTLALAEATLRALLFLPVGGLGKPLRRPGLYAQYFSDDDYWKLYYRLGPEFRPPDKPHPLLGWVGGFDRQTYLHDWTPEMRERRPVLLYGDSFAQCTTPRCFQHYFNEDPQFSRRCFLMNYGVGGYGIDQTYLLFKESVDRYRKPLVIWSLLTEDIDRTILSVRVGQKPYFDLEGGRLVLKGTPIDPDPSRFFREHPPEIPSYFWRAVDRTFGDRFAWRREAHARELEAKRERKVAIARAILADVVRELRTRELDDAVFLVFVGNWVGESYIMQEHDWRLEAILGALKKEKVPVVVTRDIVRADIARTRAKPEDYFRGDGHPNDRQNALIVAALREHLGACLAPPSASGQL
jgi:hypothetical protein